MRDAAILDYPPAVGTHAALKKEGPSARPARGSATRLHCLSAGAKGKDHQFRRIGMVLDRTFGLFAAVQESVRGRFCCKSRKFGGVENRRESRRDEKAVLKTIVARLGKPLVA